MNNLRKTAVLLFIGVFVVSMVLVPFTPMAADYQVAAPTDYEQAFVEKWADRLENDMPSEIMDPILASYIETGVLDEMVVTTRRGDTKLLLYLEPTFDSSALAEIAKVNWKIDLKLVTVASAEVSSIGDLKQLEGLKGMKYIQADRFIDYQPIGNDDPELDMFYINEVIGATGTYATDYNGAGVVVGVVDSGVDFSQEDMRNAEYNNGTYPMSYDPSSYGLTEMVIANNTVVANATEWLAAGHLLTYESGGKYYLDTDGWDPVCNNELGPRSLMGVRPPYGNGYPEGPNVGFIGLYEWAWGGNNMSEFVYHEMWKDWEIPVPTADNYTFGWAYQQKIEGYAKVFAPSMIYDGDLVIDMNGSLAWTRMWNWGIRSQHPAGTPYLPYEIDLNTTADRDLITGMMDWSFVDDIAENYVFNKDNNIIMGDVDDDGHMDVALGSLSWAYDDAGWLTFDPGLFFGITDDGMAWNALFTSNSDHGHWTAATIASAGTYDHDVYGNGTTYNLPGVAPGAKIIASKGITAGGDLAANVWCMGFTLNETSGYWEYIGDGPDHLADIVSNSWGWGPGGMWYQMRELAMVYDLASVPDVLATGYPGTLFVFSAGNEGNDYGTAGTPGGAFSVISVGAAYTSHFYETLYGPNQGYGQQVYWSGTGPSYPGYTKPDIMAPGYRGVNPNPSENDWLEAGETSHWWQGTSLSCPVVAGAAALVMQAAGSTDQQMIKNVLLSTADDMGLDPMRQGHGFLDVEEACRAVELDVVDEYIFESESLMHYDEQMIEAWDYWVPWWAPFDDIYYTTYPVVGLETSSVYFGEVSRNEVRNVTLNIENYAAAGVNSGAFDTIQPWYYIEGSRIEFQLTGYQYNDTNFDPYILRPGFFDLTDNMTVGEEALFWAANYVTLSITFDPAYQAAPDLTGGIFARLFDWTDTTGEGDLNYWNYTTSTGDEVIHIQRGGLANIIPMRIASAGTMTDVFNGAPTLQLDGADGVTVNVTMQLWSKTNDLDVEVNDHGTGAVNLTLTVDSDAEYGVHQGSISFVDVSSGFTHEVPYSYMVDMELNGATGEVMTLVDGAGPETTPYDTGLATTYFLPGTTRFDEGGGITTFHLTLPYNPAVAAEVLVMRAEWQHDGTVVDMILRNYRGSDPPRTSTDWGGGQGESVPTGDKTNTIIYEPGGLINGTYWFEVYTHMIDGTTIPEPIKITFQLYGSAALPDAIDSFTWTAKDHTTPTAIAGGQVLAGDHIVLNSTWDIPGVSGLPEYSSITSSRVSFLSGLYVELDGFYADPQGTDAWPIPMEWPPSRYVWETVPGVAQDDITTVTLNAAHGADPSFDVYMWEDADADEEVDEGELTSGSLLTVDNGGGGAVEFGTFTVPESGALAIRVFCWDWAYPGPGSDYTLTVDSQVSIDIENEVSADEYTTYDTYQFERNVNFTVWLYCWTETDVAWALRVGMVRFENFYTPEVTVNAAIDLTGDLFNFTWTASDLNADDTLYFSVWISSDGGTTFQLFAQNITETFFVWDADGFLVDDYMYMVRVYDCDHTYPLGVGAAAAPPASYWPGLSAEDVSASFEAGNVIVTPTPTTTTTTTTPTPTPTTPPPGGIDPLLIGLLGGIGVGVVILLILFLIRKK